MFAKKIHEYDDNDHDDDLPAYKWSIQRKLYATFTSLYFYANVLYVVYSIGTYYSSDITVYSDDVVQTNNYNDVYFRYGIVHVVSSWLYLLSWIGYKNWYEIEVWPDYLNVVGSALWLTAACYYPKDYVTPSYSLVFYNTSYDANVTSLANVTVGGQQILENVTVLERFTSLANYSVSNDDGLGFSSQYYLIRKLELAAAVIEVVAAPLWVWAWYTNYRDSYECDDKPTAARGWTSDDPDFHANWSIIACTVIYLAYEIQVYVDKASFTTNYLYVSADILYMVNAIFYMLGYLRDLGWLWFMPAWGRVDASWKEVEYVHVPDTDEYAVGKMPSSPSVSVKLISHVAADSTSQGARTGQPIDPSELQNDSFGGSNGGSPSSVTVVAMNDEEMKK